MTDSRNMNTIKPEQKYISSDFLGQGIANLAGGFFNGMSAGRSSSGTGLIISSGARSCWTNIFRGLFVAIIVFQFANLIELVAMPAPAGLVIVTGVKMVNVNAILRFTVFFVYDHLVYVSAEVFANKAYLLPRAATTWL